MSCPESGIAESNSGEQKAAAMIAKALGKKGSPDNIANASARANPNFSTGEFEWTHNCQRCVFAYEMRMRGYDVEAKPRLQHDSLPYRDSARGWTKVMEGATLENVFKRNEKKSALLARNKIGTKLREYGEGSRVIVSVLWKGGGGHAFIAHYSGGRIHYIDPQTGSKDCSHYFHKANLTDLQIMRVDNLEPTALITECVQRRKK